MGHGIPPKRMSLTTYLFKLQLNNLNKIRNPFKRYPQNRVLF
ncbi:hypothetical protein Agau_L101636 [Agrobacterium tumefaciens F2]|nr:hypothetical protein Agau_L101636 [Agrobacterium tumefaciens F2]